MSKPTLFRKTRIVCISDTHNQTPKLPRGDVLIHAGDLTNQGSYSELKKAVNWLERQEFEAMVVVAGNHDITLDESFFNECGNGWKWPEQQDPAACKRLLMEARGITYLENSSAKIQLKSPGGPSTTFTVFGSPCTPKQANWGFQYKSEDAEAVWAKIPNGVQIVVTHTPPKGHGDSTKNGNDRREGCPALLKRLDEVRPILSICGHIHGGRGVERLRWRNGPANDRASSTDDGSPVASLEHWNDPGAGNMKLSLVDMTTKLGRSVGHDARWTRQDCSDSLDEPHGGQPHATPLPLTDGLKPPAGDEAYRPVLSLAYGALRQSEALWTSEVGSANEIQSDIGHGCPDDALRITREGEKRKSPHDETVVINAAYLGPRIAGKSSGFHKPIVVDIALPVWEPDGQDAVG